MNHEFRNQNSITELNCGNGIVVQGDPELIEATRPLLYPLGTTDEEFSSPWTVVIARSTGEARKMIEEKKSMHWDIQEDEESGFLNAYSPSKHIYVVAGNEAEVGTLRAVRALKLMRAYEDSDSIAILHSSSGILAESGFIFASDGDNETGSGAGKTSALFAMLTSLSNAMYHSNDITALTKASDGIPSSPYIPEVLPLNEKMLAGLGIDGRQLKLDPSAGKYYAYPADLSHISQGIGIESGRLKINNILFVDLKPSDEDTIVKQIYANDALDRFIFSISLERIKQASRSNPLDPESNQVDVSEAIIDAERIFLELGNMGVSFWTLEGSVYPRNIRNALSNLIDV